jgi:hypothetical protein
MLAAAVIALLTVGVRRRAQPVDAEEQPLPAVGQPA